MDYKDVFGNTILPGCRVAVATREGYCSKRAVMRIGTVYALREYSIGVEVEKKNSKGGPYTQRIAYYKPKNMVILPKPTPPFSI